jgi:hypothetical protein
MNTALNKVRRGMGFGYWSFASFLKMKAKAAMNYVADFEHALIQCGKKHGMSGVICGHIHRPEIRTVGDVIYMNCGDWVENCTALVEDLEGNFKLIKCHENPVHSPGRGPGSHDPGDSDPADSPKKGTSGGGMPGRRESEPELAALLRKLV